MSDRITRKDCEAQLRILARKTGRPVAETWPFPPGGLRLNDESGVKRVREIPADGRGESDIGPGFLTWREVWTFLKGANAGLELVEEVSS
jgi:hypothetical protein